MSQFPNTKGQKTMAESDPVVLPSDQTISVSSNGEHLATEPTLLSILSAIQQETEFETKLVIDSLDVTYLEVRTWNTSSGTFNPPTYYLPNSNVQQTPTPPLTYINPNSYLSLVVSNTMGINLEETQQLILTGVTNNEILLNNINNKLVDGTDIGDVSINNGSGVSAVNIQDGGNSITVDGGTGFQRTPNISRPSGVTGSTPSGAYSVSISSVGTANATVGGITLKPGETLSFDGGGINNTIASISYSTITAGAELIIITLT